MGVFIHHTAFRLPGASTFSQLDRLIASNETPFEKWNDSFSGALKVDALHSEGLDCASRSFQRCDRVAQLAAVLTHDLASFSPELIHIGSARGATHTWEKEHEAFLNGRQVSLHTSPNTTLGNIAFNAAQMAGIDADVLDQSMTCSSGLHSVIEAARRIRSGEINKALAGGVETPLTKFTYAQFDALKLLSKLPLPFPCKPLLSKASNELVLAEGGALFALSKEKSPLQVLGYGEACSKTKHNLAFASAALKEAMMKALKMADLTTVDAVLMHAPGTIQGDAEEVKAVHEILGNEVRMIPTKWLTGHTLGASGPVSMVLAMALMQGTKLHIPYVFEHKMGENREVETVLVNATGFGGNAVSILLGKTAY